MVTILVKIYLVFNVYNAFVGPLNVNQNLSLDRRIISEIIKKLGTSLLYITNICKLFILLINLRLTLIFWLIIRNALIKHFKQQKKVKLTKIVTTLLKKHVLYTWKNSLFSTYIEYLIYHISARAKVFIYLWKTNFNKKPNINEILQQYMYTCISKLLFHERTICIG